MQSWTFDRLESLIKDQVEESLTLDYKAAGALQRDSRHKAEITKDVSALANSAGGVIIYGIREHADKTKAHLPQSIDPVQRKDVSKEWIEQVIQGIRPKIDGIVIHPVPVSFSPDAVVYIVEVPQSSTAHQATDLRYYRRYNFESVPMQDYEIRDVMARRQHPLIEIGFQIVLNTSQPDRYGIPLYRNDRDFDYITLEAKATNKGRRVAQIVKAKLFIPRRIINEQRSSVGKLQKIEGLEYSIYEESNLVRDVIGHGIGAQLGQHRFEPILPELTIALGWWNASEEGFLALRQEGAKLLWESYADDAPKQTGEVLLASTEVLDKRKRSHKC